MGNHDYDAEKNRTLLDSLLEASLEIMGKEVGELLGCKVSCDNIEEKLIDSKDFFALCPHQIIAAEMDFGSGEKKLGRGYFITPIKDAILLGATLIMLPESEIERSLDEGDFYEDLEDAYGEVVNIISGSLTQLMETDYTPAKTRVIKKNLHKVDLKSTHDLVEQLYYDISFTLQLNERELDRFSILFPAIALKLHKDIDNIPENIPTSTTPEIEEDTVTFPLGEALLSEQDFVNGLLNQSQECCAKEVSSLIGSKITFGEPSYTPVSKENFFKELPKKGKEKHAIARLDIESNSLAGKGCIVCEMKAAVNMGGTLIMLPPPELENAVTTEEFNEDIADAYGEIANIVAGAYTSIFEEQHKKRVRFVRREVDVVKPLEVDIDSAEPIPPNNYYKSCMELLIDGKSFGFFSILIPLELLDLQGLCHTPPEKDSVDIPEVNKEKEGLENKKKENFTDNSESSLFDILLIGDDNTTIQELAQVMREENLQPKELSFKDEILNFLNDRVKAVYLVMSEVNDQGFATAIKVNSRLSIPIIVAGPNWTRPKVITAMKYGVQDILLIPAPKEEMSKNIRKNIDF